MTNVLLQEFAPVDFRIILSGGRYVSLMLIIRALDSCSSTVWDSRVRLENILSNSQLDDVGVYFSR